MTCACNSDDRDPVKSVAERSAVPPDRVKTEHPEPAADCDSCGQAAYDSCLDCSQPLAALSAALDRVDGEDVSGAILCLAPFFVLWCYLHVRNASRVQFVPCNLQLSSILVYGSVRD